MATSNLTEEESLSLITGMINRAKNKFSETGHLYLLWGWVILVCCVTQFVLEYFYHLHNVYYVWFLTWLVLIYQVVFLSRQQKRSKVKTYTGEIVGYVWLTFAVCIILSLFVINMVKAFISINPMILILYGMPTFLSGKILKFQPLAIGGMCCWILAAISPFVFIEFQILIIGAAVIFAWIIPGYLLRKKFKKENSYE